MKIKLPSNMRAGAPMGAGTPDPSEPATTPLGEPATAVEPVVPPPVAAPGAGAVPASEPGVEGGGGGVRRR